MHDPITYLDYAFTQRAIAELILLSVIAAALGPWIILRSLGFFAHAIGTAAFPGLIAATALGMPQPLGAAAGAAATAVGAGLSSPSTGNSTRTGLWLTGSLAVGALAAGALGTSGSSVDSALFGSLLTLAPGDLLLTAAIAAVSLLASHVAGQRWLAHGLLGRSSRGWDAALLLLVALASISQLAASGSLLAGSLLLLPAAAAGRWARSIPEWRRLTLFLSATCALGGLTIALAFDLPPGATIAVVAGLTVAGSFGLRPILRAGRTAALLALLCLAPLGCGSDPGETGNGGGRNGPDVVATTPIVASIAQAVVGRSSNVRTLVPRGSDPHDFEPKPSDVAAVAGSGLVIANGGLDPWIGTLAERSGSRAAPIELLRLVPVRLSGSTIGRGADEPSADGESRTIDPHWFHDPRNVAAAAGIIASAAGRLDPANRPTYAARARSVARAALALDRDGRRCIGRLRAGQRTLVTDHDAFRYLARRTGLRIAGAVIPSTSAAAAPSARNLETLARTIESLHVRAIFPESSLDPKTARALARRTGATASIELDADTLGPKGSNRASWGQAWATNVGKIALGLSGGSIRCRIGVPPSLL